MMTKPEVNEYLARNLFGLVPCDKWEYINFGSGGGPALMAQCDHKGKCWPTNTIGGGISGKTIGGCPEYSTSQTLAVDVIIAMVERGFKYTGESLDANRYHACFLDGRAVQGATFVDAVAYAAVNALEAS